MNEPAEWEFYNYGPNQYVVEIHAQSKGEFFGYDLSELEAWAINKVANRTSFSGLLLRGVTDIKFDFNYRYIKIYVKEMRND